MPDQRPGQSYQDWITETLWSDVQSTVRYHSREKKLERKNQAELIGLGVCKFGGIDLKLLSNYFIGKELFDKEGGKIGVIKSAEAVFDGVKRLYLNYELNEVNA